MAKSVKKLSFSSIFYSPYILTDLSAFWSGTSIPSLSSWRIIWAIPPYLLDSFRWWLLHCIIFLVFTVLLISLKKSHCLPIYFPSIVFRLCDKKKAYAVFSLSVQLPVTLYCWILGCIYFLMRKGPLSLLVLWLCVVKIC